MKQVLEFEKPLIKMQDEIEDLRRRQAARPTDKLASQIADLEKTLELYKLPGIAETIEWTRALMQLAAFPDVALVYRYLQCALTHTKDDSVAPVGFIHVLNPAWVAEVLGWRLSRAAATASSASRTVARGTSSSSASWRSAGRRSPSCQRPRPSISRRISATAS